MLTGARSSLVIDANAMIQKTMISSQIPVAIEPTMMPASARPSPSSRVSRICLRAITPSTMPDGREDEGEHQREDRHGVGRRAVDAGG